MICLDVSFVLLSSGLFDVISVSRTSEKMGTMNRHRNPLSVVGGVRVGGQKWREHHSLRRTSRISLAITTKPVMSYLTRLPRQQSSRKRSNAIECKFLQCAVQLMRDDPFCCVKVLRNHEHNLCFEPHTGTCHSNDGNSGDIQQMKTNTISSVVKPVVTKLQSPAKTHRSQTTIITTTIMPANHSTPKRNTIYIKPLLVLDLNGILCHRVREANQSVKQTSRYRQSIGRIANTEIIPRSDLNPFLKYLHRHFALAVWTSATIKTAKTLVKMLFPQDIRNSLVFVWHRGVCNLINSADIDDDGNRKKKKRRKHYKSEEEAIDRADPTIHSSGNHYEDLVAIKSLSKVWSSYPLWDHTNTLLFDDSPDKCPKQFCGNAIHPIPLFGTETIYEQSAATINHDLSQESVLVVDDDEANQKQQRQFFELLVQHWSRPQTRVIDESLDGTVSSSGKSLREFLGEHAKTHNMRWENSR